MKLFISSLFCMFAVLFASVASADDYGVHNKYDFKLNLGEDTHTDLRVTPEFIFTNNADGFRQAYGRVGPSFRVVPWFTLGVNAFGSLQRSGQDVGAEVQPEFNGRVCSLLTVNDRNRLMFRPLDNATGDRWRYANELKLNLDVKGESFVPFVADELFVTSGNGVNQNRAMAGVGYRWNTNRVDLAYMLRSDAANSVWGQSHFVYLSLFSAR